eukprot:scaffold332428_cov21-Prasinocladus_malaysianus.AAC.1
MTLPGSDLTSVPDCAIFYSLRAGKLSCLSSATKSHSLVCCHSAASVVLSRLLTGPTSIGYLSGLSRVPGPISNEKTHACEQANRWNRSK